MEKSKDSRVLLLDIKFYYKVVILRRVNIYLFVYLFENI